VRRGARGIIASPEPNDLGRRAEGGRQFIEIRVRGENNKAMSFGMLPNLDVRTPEKAFEGDMRGIREEIRKLPHKFVRQVLVE